jgi:uncharacterized protein (TIGR00730 family)
MQGDVERLRSVCVFCGSNDAVDPQYLADATALGQVLAAENLKLIYGGGGVGLMGACARATHAAGGEVLGIIPQFLLTRERPLKEVETVVVTSMHERKTMMYDASDAFIVLPGGVGTLEEIVEVLSWKKMGLHAKPIVFYNPAGFFDGLLQCFERTVESRFTPESFLNDYASVSRIEDIVPALLASALTEEAPAVERAAARLT